MSKRIPIGHKIEDRIIRNTQGRVFYDEYIDLTGGFWVNCVFDGCILELHGMSAMSVLHGVIARDCQYRGSGWPDGIKVTSDG